MSADDDPGWSTCASCGRSVPNDTRGNPYPHACNSRGRLADLTPATLALLDFYAALEVGETTGPCPVRAAHVPSCRRRLVARGLLVEQVRDRLLTDAGRELVARRAAAAARALARV